jgi:sporulation protein YlmC with PRC-barrel domain
MKKLMLCAVAVALAVLGSVQAQERPRADAPNRADRKVEGTVFRSVDLIGKAVRNTKGDSLGQVEDYVVNLKDGNVVYVAMSYGQTLGFGGKLFAVHPQDIRLNDDWTAFVMNANKEDFEKADGYDANKWPTAPGRRWQAGATNDRPAKAEPRNDDKADGMHLRRLTSLNGLSVRNEANETLGSAQGFGMDLHNNKVVYITFAYGGIAGVGSKYFAIPWEAAMLKAPDLKTDAKVFVIKANKADFESRDGFNYNRWPSKPDEFFTKK